MTFSVSRENLGNLCVCAGRVIGTVLPEAKVLSQANLTHHISVRRDLSVTLKGRLKGGL